MAAHSWKTEAFDACTKLGQALPLQPEGRSRCAQASVRVALPGAPAPGRPGFQRRTVTAHRQTPRLAGPVTRGAQRQRRDPRLLVRAGHRQDPRRQHGVVRRRQARYPHYPDRLVMDFGNLEGGGVQRVVQAARSRRVARGVQAGAKRHGLTPRARVVASAAAGVAPRIMGMGPVPATRKALSRAKLSLDDMNVIELNEAFASQALAVLRELHVPDDAAHVNPNGGAIALGHPLGASGARLIATATYHLSRTGGKYALCTMCIGVGQGQAIILERV